MSPNSTTVGLAIVTMDRFEDTVETLLQIDLGKFEQVILVDDSSGSELETWREDRDEISYQRGPQENMQAARNQAIDSLSTDVITFVDDDVYCPADFADRVRSRFEESDDLVAAGGPCPSVVGQPDYGVCDFPTLSITKGGTIYGDASTLIPEDAIYVDTLKGANMSFCRETLREIGGFDTEYGGHSQREETDVFARIGKYGKISYDPDLLCYHKEKGDEFTPELFTWRFRNHGRFVRKNFGLSASVLSFFSIFLRLCGSPESIYQLVFEKYVQNRPVPIARCLSSYIKGVLDYQVE